MKPNELSLHTKQGKLFLACAGVVFLVIILLMVNTCQGLFGCSDTNADTQPTVSSTDSAIVEPAPEIKENVSQSGNVEYGVIPTDGSVPLERVMLLNVYHTAEHVLNGTAIVTDNDNTEVYVNGQLVSGNNLPERYVYEDGTVVWQKRVYIADGLDYVSINVIPDEEAENCNLSVMYPDGSVATAADGVFTYPSAGTFRWNVDYPVGGIYTFSITGQNIDTYYVDILAYH